MDSQNELLMKLPTSLKSLIVNADSLLANTLDLDAFNSARFYIVAPTPYMVSISGSTESNLKDNSQKQVLDASTMKSDELGNIFMATADGLGESDEIEDSANNAAISAYCCEAFCNRAIGDKRTEADNLKRIAKESKAKNATSQDGLPYDGRTAMSALTFNSKTKKARAVSIGDTLTVIFDGKTGDLKFQQEARVYNQGGAIWAPLDLQMLAHAKPNVAQFAELALQVNEWDLEDNDIVVQMSDGIWAQFSTEDIEIKLENGASYLATRLKIKNISELSERLKPSELSDANALAITQALHSSAMITTRNTIALFQEIHSELSQKLELEPCSSEKTMGQFVKELPLQIATRFQQLYIAQKHDSIMYDDDLPVIVFHQQYKKISFGDCATISVFKVPEKFDSILGILLNNISILPNYVHELNAIMALEDEKIISLFHKFEHYHIIEEKKPLTSSPGVLVHPTDSVYFLKNFIQQLKICKKTADTEPNVYLKRAKILQYVNSIQDEQGRSFLANFLSKNSSCVFQEISRFSFFKRQEGVSAKDFIAHLSTIGSGRR